LIGNPLSIEHLRLALRRARNKAVSDIPWTSGAASVKDLSLRILHSKENAEIDGFRNMLDMAQLAVANQSIEAAFDRNNTAGRPIDKKNAVLCDLFPIITR
jgi:hypothetical protein